MEARIKIKVKTKKVVEGQWEEEVAPYYECWCTPLELWGKELYAAMQSKYENVLVFKVRYCNKVRAMRKTEKSKYLVVFEGANYEVFQVDFKNNSKDWVFIKAKMVI